MATKATEVAEKASYERGVLDIETQLVEEVVGVCRDYCTEVWAEALNQAGVPAGSELRSARNIFIPEAIREDPAKLHPSVALPLPPLEHSLTIQESSLNAEVSVRAGKGKEVQPPIKVSQFEDTFIIRDVVSKAKEAEGVELKAVDSKKGPHPAKE